MFSVALVLLLSETGKEGRRIGSYRITNLVRSRQDIDRSVLKAEHPEVYASVLKVVTWNHMAVEYVPEQVETPPVPQMWQPLAPGEEDDYPF